MALRIIDPIGAPASKLKLVLCVIGVVICMIILMVAKPGANNNMVAIKSAPKTLLKSLSTDNRGWGAYAARMSVVYAISKRPTPTAQPKSLPGSPTQAVDTSLPKPAPATPADSSRGTAVPAAPDNCSRHVRLPDGGCGRTTCPEDYSDSSCSGCGTSGGNCVAAE